MTNLFSAPWKLATIAGGLVSLVIGGLLITSYIENREISKQRDELQRSITDPETGYIARLTQAKANVVELNAALETQNAKYRQLSAESAAALEASRRRLLAAQRERDQLQSRLDTFLAQPIEGETLEERVLDVDRRAMKEFLNEDAD